MGDYHISMQAGQTTTPTEPSSGDTAAEHTTPLDQAKSAMKKVLDVVAGRKH